ncbi:MAG: hypothetical protein SOX83_02490, partial [Sodaliphilus sp.]|nr:hypothetical protein [Sodaliphilus sp.]
VADLLPFLSRQTLKFYHLFALLGVNFFQGETHIFQCGGDMRKATLPVQGARWLVVSTAGGG